MTTGRWIRTFFCACCLWLSTAATADVGKPTILIVGDSLSAAYGIAQEAGWVALLQQRLAQTGYPHRVVNASISGDTTRGGLERLPMALRTHQPDIVIIELGGNDGLRGLSLSDMAANLRGLVRKSKEAGAQVLLVGIILPPNYGPQYTAVFARTYETVAQESKIPLVRNLFSGIGENMSAFQPDGIHPTAASQGRLLENVWVELKPMLGGKRASP